MITHIKWLNSSFWKLEHGCKLPTNKIYQEFFATCAYLEDNVASKWSHVGSYNRAEVNPTRNDALGRTLDQIVHFDAQANPTYQILVTCTYFLQPIILFIL
jgi:hypothetical protein